MGLDMWIYGIKDIKDHIIPVNMPASWYYANDYSLTQIDENDDDFIEKYADLEPYSVRRNVVYTKTDFEKIRADYNIPEDTIMGGYTNSMDGKSVKFRFYLDSKMFTVSLSKRELELYCVYIPIESFVFKKEELAYWRSLPDLQALIYKEYPNVIRNTGYHELDKDVLKKIVRWLTCYRFPLQKIKTAGYAAKMYHEWH